MNDFARATKKDTSRYETAYRIIADRGEITMSELGSILYPHIRYSQVYVEKLLMSMDVNGYRVAENKESGRGVVLSLCPHKLDVNWTVLGDGIRRGSSSVKAGKHRSMRVSQI